MTAITRDQAFDRMHEIYERLSHIAGKPQMTRADDREFEQLRDEFGQLRKVVDRSDHLAEIVGAARGVGGLRLEGEHNAIRPFGEGLERDGRHPDAMRRLERSVRAGFPARAAETVERLIATGPDHERSWAERWVVETGSEDYKSAWGKLVMFGESRAGLEWTPAERAAYDRVSRLKQAQRALSLTDSAGAY